MNGAFVPLRSPCMCPACGNDGITFSITCDRMIPAIINFTCGYCGHTWTQDAEYVENFTRENEQVFSAMRKIKNFIQKRDNIHDCPKCGGYMKLNHTKIGFWRCNSCGFEISHEENIRLLCEKEKEESAMSTLKVSCRGFTGELMKLEASQIVNFDPARREISVYDISIYDREKNVTHTLTDVKLEDITFLGAEVHF